MTTPDNSRFEIMQEATSTKEAKSRSTGGGWHRSFWLASLAIIGAGLAVHGALAYSPELANYVPESVLSSPHSECPISKALGTAGCSTQSSCQSSAGCSLQMSGCCSSSLGELLAETITEPAAIEVSEIPADALAPEAN
jgi:hypothetical protein